MLQPPEAPQRHPVRVLLLEDDPMAVVDDPRLTSAYTYAVELSSFTGQSAAGLPPPSSAHGYPDDDGGLAQPAGEKGDRIGHLSLQRGHQLPCPMSPPLRPWSDK